MPTLERHRAVVASDLAAVLKGLADRGLATPEPAEVGIAEARRRNLEYFAAIAGDAPVPARAETVDVRGEDGGLSRMRVVIPANARSGAPAVLYMHGGGYAFGDLVTHDHIFRWLAEASGLTVFGLDYRRTPEHAYPAQVQDALAAVAAIRGPDLAARFGHDGGRVVLFGDSAGAHLCMSLMLALKARGLPQPLGAALAYGMYQRRFDTWSHRTYGDGSYGLSTFRMGWFWDQLLAGQVLAGNGGRRDVIAEPLLADLDGLPPLALYGAECDCLLDDTLDLVERAKAASHPHSFHLFSGMTHAFLHLPGVYPGAREAIGRIGAKLREMV